MISSIASSAVFGPARVIAHRQLSMSCAQSVNKLHTILEEYRSTNYAQELPKRFRKDIVKAASSRSSSSPFTSTVSPVSDAVITAQGIESVLNNIGAGHRMPRNEIEFILREIGGSSRSGEPESCVISADQLMDLISLRRNV